MQIISYNIRGLWFFQKKSSIFLSEQFGCSVISFSGTSLQIPIVVPDLQVSALVILEVTSTTSDNWWVFFRLYFSCCKLRRVAGHFSFLFFPVCNWSSPWPRAGPELAVHERWKICSGEANKQDGFLQPTRFECSKPQWTNTAVQINCSRPPLWACGLCVYAALASQAQLNHKFIPRESHRRAHDRINQRLHFFCNACWHFPDIGRKGGERQRYIFPITSKSNSSEGLSCSSKSSGRQTCGWLIAIFAVNSF